MARWDKLSQSSRPFPDRVLAGAHELVGINYAAKSVSRFLLNDDESSGVLRGDIVAVETTVIPLLKHPIDFAVMNSVYYILDSERGQIVIWSPVLSDATVLNYTGFAAQPSAIASDGARIVLGDAVDGSFRLLEGVEPADFLFDGARTSQGLVVLYTYLSKLGLLPERPYTIQAGDTLESIAHSQGVLPSGFTDSFLPFLCHINSGTCPSGSLLLQPNSSVKLPDLPLQTFIGKRLVNLSTLESLWKKPVTLREAMDPVPFGLGESELKAKLLQFNPGLPTDLWDKRTSGEFIVPTLVVRTTAMVSTNLVHATHGLDERLKGEARIYRYSGENIQKKSTLSRPLSASPTLPDVPAYFADIHYHRVQSLSPVDVVVVDDPFNAAHPEFSVGPNGS